jgi:hypothetical protein
VIALAAVLLLQGAADRETCHLELSGLSVENSTLRQALVADGSLLNLSPLELGDVSVEVAVFADNKILARTMPRATWARIPPRKGVSIGVKDDPLGNIPFGFARVKISYRLDGVERVFEYEGDKLRFGKLFRDPAPGTRLGLAGLRTVPGSTQVVNKKAVTGPESVFLRLRIENLDEKARPEGPIEMTLSLDGKKQGSVKRTIQPSHFKLDARNLPAADADPQIIAFDAATRELVIGFCRLGDDRRGAKLGLDVKFTWKKQVWTWSALEPPFLEAPRTADAP